MVTFKNMGRLGNYLFECATAYAYSLRHGLDFTVPAKTNDKFWNPVYFKHLAKPLPNLQFVHIKESGHEYNPLPFEEIWRNKNIILDGYWQSEKYFKEYRERILALFGAPTVNQYGITSIHIRLGDYKLYPHKHPVVPYEFYRDGIELILNKTDNRIFKLFSDEPKEANNIIDRAMSMVRMGDVGRVSFEFVSGNDELTDLRLIAECENHINSSSTFSWWGAWLNPNLDKIIITPKLWFVPGHNNLETKDIIPPEWIKL